MAHVCLGDHPSGTIAPKRLATVVRLTPSVSYALLPQRGPTLLGGGALVVGRVCLGIRLLSV